MNIQISIGQQTYRIDTQQPIVIALPLHDRTDAVNCFWAPPVQISPVRMGDFVGDTQQGGAVNFKTVRLNPHGNGTHTECVGHIATEPYTLDQCLTKYLHLAQLVSIYPQKQSDSGDRVITQQQLAEAWQPAPYCTAALIRTLPNDDLKQRTNYSGSNPPYLHHSAISWLVQQGIDHLLVDLPSVDREQDDGRLLAHKAFWQYPSEQVRSHATITELMYAPNNIADGIYLLDLQVTALVLDASPSQPILYALQATTA